MLNNIKKYLVVLLFTAIFVETKNIKMKTIEDAAKEYASNLSSSEVFKSQHDKDFRAGAEFGQTWIPIEDELPMAYEVGEWDGLRSDFVLVKNQFGDWNKGQLYSGTLDGHQFNDWCDEDGYYFSNITHWRPIEFK